MEEAQIKQIIERQPLHGSALLDPRCKILLLICIGFVSYFLAGEVVSLALMLVYGLFIALGNGGKWALKMIVIYIIVAYLNALLRYVQVPVLSVIMSVFGVTLLKLIPIVMMGLWILRTTYMDDLLVALQRMRLPQAVTIPLVVMFRYIPTLRIEYHQIRSTMDIRGISDTLWKRVSHPLATIREDCKEKVDTALEDLELSEYREQHPAALSGGQKQRVTIGAAIVKDSPVIYFDEPTSGLDYDSMVRVSRLIEQLSASGVIVFVVSHDFEFIVRTCTEVVQLDDQGAIQNHRLTPQILKTLAEKYFN